MLHTSAGTRIDAAQHARDAAIHQLNADEPFHKPDWNARLGLRFEAQGSRTRMSVDTQEPPWKVLRAFEQSNGGALVHLHNVSGGILSGDRLSLRLHVGSGAVAQVTTTGATRLYRHRELSSDSEQDLSITVAEGGLLEYLPDALIPFRGSRHSQRTVVNLADGATFFWWETVAPGRQAMGESFAFDRLQIQTEVRSHLRPVVLENFVLQPDVSSLRSASRMGEYSHTATFYAVQVGRPAAELRQLESLLAEQAHAVSHPGVTIWGASALAADGVVVRGLSATARELSATLARFWNTARQFLTGESPIPPRKLK
ncbi:MAG: urease accessory protein UreD [Acidobacteriota bacterium]